MPVEVYNSTPVPHLARYASENLRALGLDAEIGPTGKRYSGYPETEILFPRGDEAQAQALKAQIVGSVTTQESGYSAI